MTEKSDTLQDSQPVEDIVDAENAYRTHIQEAREERIRKKVEKSREEFREDVNQMDQKIEEEQPSVQSDEKHSVEYQDLSRDEGRIVNVKNNGDSHTVVFKDRYGNKYTQDLSIGLPEDKSEWERLCEHIGVAPYPAEAMGETIPILIPSSTDEPLFDISFFKGSHIEPSRIEDRLDQPRIDVPPVMGGLNPYVYKAKRTVVQSLKHSGLFKKTVEAVGYFAPIWMPALLLPILFALFALSATGVQSGSLVVSVVSFPFVAIFAGILSILVLYTVRIYGMILLSWAGYLTIHGIEYIGPKLESLYRKLFPKE